MARKTNLRKFACMVVLRRRLRGFILVFVIITRAIDVEDRFKVWSVDEEMNGFGRELKQYTRPESSQ